MANHAHESGRRKLDMNDHHIIFLCELHGEDGSC